MSAGGKLPLDELAAAALFEQFEQGALPERCLSHRQHVRVAWLYLERYPPLAAMARFSTALRRLAEAYAKPGLYHETITWAYLLLIHERRERGRERLPGAPVVSAEPDAGWQAFAAANPDLLTWRPSILAAYYRDETLGSELARRAFVMPDRACLTTGGTHSGAPSAPPPGS